MSFNPTLESAINPISVGNGTVSPVQGLASLLDVFKPSAPKPTAQPSAADLKDQASRAYFAEMDKASQLRAQGDEQAAQNTARTALRGLTSQYGLDQVEGAAELYSTFSGLDASVVTTGKTSLNESLRSDPEYAKNLSFVRMSNPDISEEQLDQKAMQITMQSQANAQELTMLQQQEAVTWVKAKPVYDDGIKLAREELQRMVSTYKKDSIISVEEASAIRKYWTDVLNKFQAPPGVPMEQWEQYKKSYIDPIQDVVNAGLDGILNSEASEDMPRALSQIVDVLVADGKLPPALRVNLAPNGTGDAMQGLKTAIEMMGADAGNGQWATQIETVLKMDYDQLLNFAQNFETADASWVDKVDASPFLEGDNAQKAGTLSQDKVRAMSTNPGTAAEGVISLIEHVGAVDSNTHFTGDMMKSIFDQRLFDKVEELATINPEAGGAIKERLDMALATRLEASQKYVTKVANQNGFELRDNGFGETQLVLSEKFMTEQQKQDLQVHFGGSIAAAIAAKGRVTPKPGGGMFGGGALPVSTSLSIAFDEIPKIDAELKAYAAIKDIRDKKFGVAEAEDNTSVAPTGMEYALPEEVAKDTAFVNAIKGVAQNNNIKPDDLARIIAFESANTWSPSVRNPGSSATGLIQFMSETAKSLGTTTDELSRMTRDQQMVYVDKYLQQYKGKLKNFGDIYMAIHWPAGIGQDESYIMYKAGSKEYEGNKNLDTNGDGTVTRGETIARVIGATPANGAVLRSPGIAGYEAEVGAMQTSTRPQPTPDPVQAMTVAPAQGAPAVGAGPGVREMTTEPILQNTPTTENVDDTGRGLYPSVTNKAIKDYLDSLIGKENGIKSFASNSEMQEALSAGLIKSGDLVAVDGEIRIVP